MKYPPTYFRDGLPEWKRKKDPIIGRLIYRPLSYPISSLFAELGIGANAVSFGSVIVGVAACLSFVLSHPIIGALLVNVWSILDSVDGNLARCIKSEKYGEFADAMSSYVCTAFLFPCIGFYVACNYDSIAMSMPALNLMLISAFASCADILSRLLFQKFKLATYRYDPPAPEQLALEENSENPSKLNRLLKKVDESMSIGGYLPLVLLLAAVFHFLDYVLIVWAVYTVAVLVASALLHVKRVLAANADLRRRA